MVTRIKPLPPFEYLRSLFDYEPETGHLRWKRREFSNALQTIQFERNHLGQIAGDVNNYGYRVVGINRKIYTAHRIAWSIHYGEDIPVDVQIDHRNCNRDDNRIANLRRAIQWQNQGNSKKWRGKSLPKGVTLQQSGKGYLSRIQISGKSVCLGTFQTPEAAHAAYVAAATAAFGEFARAE